MAHSVSLPFTIRRSDDVVGAGSFTQTKETIHGLLRLVEDRIIIEWRLYRETGYVGRVIRTDRQVDAVRTVTVPLHRVAGAHVQQSRLPWPFRPVLILTAADLQAFEEIAGEHGLQLAHPAELVLTLRRSDRLRADEFAAELALAIAEHGESSAPRQSLPEAGDIRSLPGGSGGSPGLGSGGSGTSGRSA
jgi:hypothetical protein